MDLFETEQPHRLQPLVVSAPAARRVVQWVHTVPDNVQTTLAGAVHFLKSERMPRQVSNQE